MATIHSVLEPQARDATATALQQTLVDLIDLGLVAKQAHWTVTGPRFRSLHQQLDEVVDTTRTHADTIAERCAAIGVAPNTATAGRSFRGVRVVCGSGRLGRVGCTVAGRLTRPGRVRQRVV
ncbi:Dps family protein, partial [Paractinoplanes rhizophilus]